MKTSARAAGDNSAPVQQGADAELLLLGCTWEAAIAAARLAEDEYNAAHDDPSRAAELAEDDPSGPMLAANDRVNALVDSILEAPASTLRGLAVKAAVVGRELDLHYGDDTGEPACRCARALVESIRRLAASVPAPHIGPRKETKTRASAQ